MQAFYPSGGGSKVTCAAVCVINTLTNRKPGCRLGKIPCSYQSDGQQDTDIYTLSLYVHVVGSMSHSHPSVAPSRRASWLPGVGEERWHDWLYSGRKQGIEIESHNSLQPCPSSGWFKNIEPLHYRDSKVCRVLTHEFGVVRHYRNVSLCSLWG